MQSLRLKYAMIKLKPGFHMIATVACDRCDCWEKKNFSDRSDHSDHMKPLSGWLEMRKGHPTF